MRQVISKIVLDLACLDRQPFEIPIGSKIKKVEAENGVLRLYFLVNSDAKKISRMFTIYNNRYDSAKEIRHKNHIFRKKFKYVNHEGEIEVLHLFEVL